MIFYFIILYYILYFILLSYFISISKQKPKSILYQKYHNAVSKLRKHNLWDHSTASSSRLTSTAHNYKTALLSAPPEEIGKYLYKLFIQMSLGCLANISIPPVMYKIIIIIIGIIFVFHAKISIPIHIIKLNTN